MAAQRILLWFNPMNFESRIPSRYETYIAGFTLHSKDEFYRSARTDSQAIEMEFRTRFEL